MKNSPVKMFGIPFNVAGSVAKTLGKTLPKRSAKTWDDLVSEAARTMQSGKPGPATAASPPRKRTGKRFLLP